MGKKRARLAKALRARKTTRTISSLIGLTAFLEQITVKDRSKYSNLPMMQKAMAVINNVTGNIFNFNIFNGVPKFKQQINPAGMANKWVGIGLGLIIAEMIGSKIVAPMTGHRIPMLRKVATLGKYILPAGLIGGFFDQAGTNNFNTSPSSNWSSNYETELTSQP